MGFLLQQLGSEFRFLTCTIAQDDIFKPNHYLSLLEFRQLTLERLQKFVAQQYFITKDYIDGKYMPSKLLCTKYFPHAIFMLHTPDSTQNC